MALIETLERSRNLLGAYRDLLTGLAALGHGERDKAHEAAEAIDKVRDDLHDEILLAQLAARRVM